MAQIERSKELFEKSRRSLAGGVSSNVRAGAVPFPLFFSNGRGSRIQDVDGNEYVDYVLGQGPLILGHSHPDLIKAVQDAIEGGQLFAGQHVLEIELSEKLQTLIPCADLVRFCNTGSEAVAAALRLARAATGRDKVIKFEGHYHGWFDDLLVSVHPPLDLAGPRASPRSVPGTKGQASHVLDDIVVLPWNDLDVLENFMMSQGDECAAVIMEPVMCNTGCILPKDGYLEGVRDLCTQYGTVLIFDEIITGFRLGLGGAQTFFGVTPDLATFGKAMGGGFPISCFAGNREMMELIGSGEVNHSGTFNSNVLVMAAALATIKILESESVVDRLFDFGTRLMEDLQALTDEAGLPIHISGIGPMFHTTFSDGESIFDYRTLMEHADPSGLHTFVTALMEHGVRVTPRGLWYLSAAHTESDIAFTLDATKSILETYGEVVRG